MALNDDNVDSYIFLDMTEVDILTAKDNKDLTKEIRLACEEKLKFREKLAQNVSIFRLDYILRVMKKVLRKISIADPNGYKQKLRLLKKSERIERLRRSDSKGSEWSETVISKS